MLCPPSAAARLVLLASAPVSRLPARHKHRMHPLFSCTAAIKFLTYEQLSRKISHYLIDQGGDGQLNPVLRLTAGAGGWRCPLMARLRCCRAVLAGRAWAWRLIYHACGCARLCGRRRRHQRCLPCAPGTHWTLEVSSLGAHFVMLHPHQCVPLCVSPFRRPQARALWA